MSFKHILEPLGIEPVNAGGFGGRWLGRGRELDVITPLDGKKIASVRQCTAKDYEKISAAAQEAFEYWREVPAPRRGELVRQLGLELRPHTENLGKLVTLGR